MDLLCLEAVSTVMDKDETMHKDTDEEEINLNHLEQQETCAGQEPQAKKLKLESPSSPITSSIRRLELAIQGQNLAIQTQCNILKDMKQAVAALAAEVKLNTEKIARIGHDLPAGSDTLAANIGRADSFLAFCAKETTLLQKTQAVVKNAVKDALQSRLDQTTVFAPSVSQGLPPPIPHSNCLRLRHSKEEKDDGKPQREKTRVVKEEGEDETIMTDDETAGNWLIKLPATADDMLPFSFIWSRPFQGSVSTDDVENPYNRPFRRLLVPYPCLARAVPGFKREGATVRDLQACLSLSDQFCAALFLGPAAPPLAREIWASEQYALLPTPANVEPGGRRRRAQGPAAALAAAAAADPAPGAAEAEAPPPPPVAPPGGGGGGEKAGYTVGFSADHALLHVLMSVDLDDEDRQALKQREREVALTLQAMSRSFNQLGNYPSVEAKVMKAVLEDLNKPNLYAHLDRAWQAGLWVRVFFGGTAMKRCLAAAFDPQHGPADAQAAAEQNGLAVLDYWERLFDTNEDSNMHESMDFDIKSFSEGVLMRFAECRKKRHGLNGCQPAALCAHFQRVCTRKARQVSAELRAVDRACREVLAELGTLLCKLLYALGYLELRSPPGALLAVMEALHFAVISASCRGPGATVGIMEQAFKKINPSSIMRYWLGNSSPGCVRPGGHFQVETYVEYKDAGGRTVQVPSAPAAAAAAAPPLAAAPLAEAAAAAGAPGAGCTAGLPQVLEFPCDPASSFFVFGGAFRREPRGEGRPLEGALGARRRELARAGGTTRRKAARARHKGGGAGAGGGGAGDAGPAGAEGGASSTEGGAGPGPGAGAGPGPGLGVGAGPGGEGLPPADPALGGIPV